MTTLAQVIAEACRLHLMRGLEDSMAHAGFSRVAGVDEVGRGCLAGPVVAAAVIPDAEIALPGVDDSKALTAAEREGLALAIRATARASAVVFVSAAIIDRINILQASCLAMRQALERLDPAPECAVVDAVTLRGLGFPCVALVRGDQISYAVACASILAKVERDRYMRELAADFPQYGFETHKGYGAPEHLAALREFGPCAEHRLTFRTVVPRVEAA
ncbi:MAG: ribonuclease HII [Acidobacteriota bacterium]